MNIETSASEIKTAIKLLSKHKYRSVSNVVGEYVETLIASAARGEPAKHCQKGFDVFSRNLGKIEVKSRNFHAKSKRCTLPNRKIESLDNFILVIIKDAEIERALQFSKEVLLGMKSASGSVYVDTQHYDLAIDISVKLRNNFL